MEHLLGAKHGAAPIRVPFIAESYDHGEFLTFPARCGWNISTWKDVSATATRFDQNDRSLEEVASFLQTWLYVGLLVSALGKDLPLDDFIDRNESTQPVISTRLLGLHIEKWRKQVDDYQEEDKDSISTTIEDIFIEANAVNKGLSFILFYGDLSEEEERTLSGTLFIQKLLLEALATSFQEVLDIGDVGGGIFYDVELENRLLQGGWCPKTVDFMQHNLPLQIQSYAFVLGSTRANSLHAECTVGEIGGCRLGQMGLDFKPCHVESDCTCDSVSPPMSKVIEMLQGGYIPILSIKRNTEEIPNLKIYVDGIRLDDPDFNGSLVGCPFLAFSHMWSDGLGNPHDNALPKCQLERLEGIIQTLKGTGTWAETLTTYHGTTAKELGTISFWLDTLCIPVNPEYQHLRDFSIQKMHEIYAKAAGVIALDPDIQHLPENAKPVDILTRALCCGWRSRLWTYQEAALSQSLYLPIRGACATFSVTDDIESDVSRPSLLESGLLTELRRKYFELVYDNLAAYHITNKPERAFTRMIRASVNRSTSRQGDEAICLGTFLQHDVSGLLPLAPENRLPAFLTQMKTIPPELLFTYGPRIQQDGFRWAPTTFLAPHGLKPHIKIILPKYRGNDSNDQDQHEVRRPYLHSNPSGYTIFLPAIEFKPNYSQIPVDFSITTKGRVYSVSLQDTAAYKKILIPRGDSSATFGILLTDLESCSLGLLVEIERGLEQGMSLCRWRCIVEVNEVETESWEEHVEDSTEASFDGQRLPFQWWVID